MIELANITSVQVTWNQPEGGLEVDEYVVSYHRLNGRDGQCSPFQDEGNVTVRAGREGETNSANLHLQAYGVYVIYQFDKQKRCSIQYLNSLTV